MVDWLIGVALASGAGAAAEEPTDRDLMWVQPHHGITLIAGVGPAVMSSLGVGVQVPAGETYVWGAGVGLLGAGIYLRKYHHRFERARYRAAWFTQTSLGASIEPVTFSTRIVGLAAGQTFVLDSGLTLDWSAGGTFGLNADFEDYYVPWIGVAAGWSWSTRQGEIRMN